ncbi:hypothetical protein ABZ404_37140 [Streptomyces sp. NPDC005878]|uniref:hypothetical protein n=1 Tax=Streptomyces sp. NPDC005878 TaxID=3157077 RepID=UPI0033EF0AC6
MRTRTRRHRTTHKPTPAPIPAPAAKGLDIRARAPFITDTQIRAAYAAAMAGVSYTRITGWLRQSDGSVRYAMPTGGALTYDPAAKQPLTAWTPCAAAVRHPHPLTIPGDLLDAQHEALTCTEHGTPTVITLHEALISDPAADDTVQMDLTALRRDHDDQPKGHPQP